jgi:hypothetical protein
MNKLRVRDNERGQFQVKLTSTEGTISCVVSVTRELAGPERRQTALRLAKLLAGRLDGEISVSRPSAELIGRPGAHDLTGASRAPRQ